MWSLTNRHKLFIVPKNNKYTSDMKKQIDIAKYQFSSPFIMSSLALGILNYPNTIMFQNIVEGDVARVTKENIRITFRPSQTQ